MTSDSRLHFRLLGAFRVEQDGREVELGPRLQRTRLAEARGEAATAAAYGAHYLCVAEAAAPHLTGSEQGTWFARLDADWANLRRAAEQAADCPDGTGQVLRLGVALRRYWTARDRGGEALALLMPALDRPEAEADPELFGTALVTAAIAARHVDIARARQLGEQAVKLARQLHASRLLIASLAALSAAYYHAGELERGLSSGREAVQRARRLGDDVLLGVSLTECVLCEALIDPARAWALLTEAIACTQRSGDHLYANALTNYAAVHALRAGDIPTARAYLRRAAQNMQGMGDKRLNVPINLGWVLRQDYDPDGARASFEEVLRVSRRNGDRYGIAYASLGLACLAADADDWHRAAVLHGIAQAFLDRTGRPWEDLEARYRRDSLDLICAHLGQEQFEQAQAEGMALSPEKALKLASEEASQTGL